MLGDLFKEPSSKRYGAGVKYVQGIPEVPKPSTGCVIVGFKDNVNVQVFPGGKHDILWKDILDIKAETQGEISKQISLHKAAIGYLFLGPFGALLGASKSKKDNRTLFLTVYYRKESKQCALLLETKDAYKIFNDLNARWESYCTSHEIDIQQQRELISMGSDSELQTLIQKKAKGIINEDEFKAKRKC